jgi:hypothetical protein
LRIINEDIKHKNGRVKESLLRKQTYIKDVKVITSIKLSFNQWEFPFIPH